MAQIAWKFTSKTNAERMLAGDFVVSSLAYFAALETLSNIPGQGDESERGTVYRFTGEYIVGDPLSDGVAEICRARRDDPDGLPKITGGEWVRPNRHGHLFCATEAPFGEAEKIFCGEWGCTAALKISDWPEFCRLLSEEGVLPDADNRPVGDLFDAWQAGKVEYGNKVVEYDLRTDAAYGTFTKPVELENQREIRLFLPAKSKNIHDQVAIRCPTAAGLLSLYEGPLPVGPTASWNLRDQFENIPAQVVELRELRRKHREEAPLWSPTSEDPEIKDKEWAAHRKENIKHSMEYKKATSKIGATVAWFLRLDGSCRHDMNAVYEAADADDITHILQQLVARDPRNMLEPFPHFGRQISDDDASTLLALIRERGPA